MMYGSYENARQASASSHETSSESEAVKEYRRVETLLRAGGDVLDGKSLSDQNECIRRASSEQLEGITRLPTVLEKHPHPNLAENCIICLANVFLKSKDIQRQCIAASLRRCRFREFPSLDNFLGIILNVQHQNDFRARAALLTVIGAIAEHLSGNRTVSHLIRRSLDSLDESEQDAAIWAAQQFIKHDSEFAVATIGHVVRMLNDPSVSLQTYRRLVQILGASHSAASDNAMACLTQQLQNLNTESPIGRVECQLASECATQLLRLALRIPPLSESVSEQLVNSALHDPRPSLQKHCLHALEWLAKREAFSETAVDKIIEFIKNNVATRNENVGMLVRIMRHTISRHNLEITEDFCTTIYDCYLRSEKISVRAELCGVMGAALAVNEHASKILSRDDVLSCIAELVEESSIFANSAINFAVKNLLAISGENDGVSPIVDILLERLRKCEDHLPCLNLLSLIAWRTPVDSGELTLSKDLSPHTKMIYNNVLLMGLSKSKEAELVKGYPEQKFSFDLYRLIRACFRYRRFHLASYLANMLVKNTKGHVSFKYQVHFGHLLQISTVESALRDSDEEDTAKILRIIEDGFDLFTEFAVEVRSVAKVWLDSRALLFRAVSSFIQDNSETPKTYLVSDVKDCINSISQLLLNQRGAGLSCRKAFQMVQKILTAVSNILCHEEENLIVIPDVDVDIFGHEVATHLRHQFTACKKRLSERKRVHAIICLLKIQLGYPKIFFISPKVQDVKIDISPAIEKTYPKGTSLVITCDGLLPHGAKAIKIIYSLKPPFTDGKAGVYSSFTEYGLVKKKFFSSNFAIQFKEAGLHRLRLDYHLIDFDNTQWAKKHFREIQLNCTDYRSHRSHLHTLSSN